MSCIIYKVILKELFNDEMGFAVYANMIGGDKIDYIFFLEEVEGHFLLFQQNYWPNHKGYSPEIINQIAHSKKEGLEKLHKYALKILKGNKKRNTSYDFEDQTNFKDNKLR